MDVERRARQFDQFTRALAALETRRAALRRLSVLPLLLTLIFLPGDDEADASGRRKRRKKRHKRGKNRHHRQRERARKRKASGSDPSCRADSTARTCASRCGTIRNNCRQQVDCGPCACDPRCPVCERCDEAAGACLPDPLQSGDACGQPGQICQDDGTCRCDVSRCAPCATCQGDGLCSAPCGGSGCCDAGTCASGAADPACGTSGNSCLRCTLPQTCGGAGAAGVCGCTPRPTCSPPLNCGSIDDDCGGQLACGGPCGGTTPICAANVCTPCDSTAQCLAAGQGDLCCGGACVTGICCADAGCRPNGDACQANQCFCGSDRPCSGSAPDCCGDPGACVNTNTDPAHCGACGAVPCAAGERCWNGVCVCGDVCPSGCQFSSVQAAIDAANPGAVIRICPGVYDRITLARDVTLTGTVGGADAAPLLYGLALGPVVIIEPGVTATLRHLRLKNGQHDAGGGVVHRGASLTMHDCFIAENTGAEQAGGIFVGRGSTLEMNRCTIDNNDAPGSVADGHGGGMVNLGTARLTDCRVTDNVGRGFGGGIENNAGTLILTNCTLDWNAASSGGGIFTYNGGTVTLNDSVITRNQALFAGGGISFLDSVVTLNGSSSVTANTPNNCSGSPPVAGCSG